MADSGEILESASVTSEAIYQEHMKAFVEGFVEKQRRDRWLYLLLERPKKAFRDSHKLHNDLNRSHCALITDATEIAPKQTGVYYDFYDEPRNLTMAEALAIGTINDAIFSIKPGKLALYFFHESEVWLCKKP